MQEMFWGERHGVLHDPYGHRWALLTAREQAHLTTSPTAPHPTSTSTRASWRRPGPGARRPRWTCRSVVETAVVSAGPVPPVLVPPAGPPCPPTAQSPDGVHGRSCVCRGRHGGVRRNHGVSAGRRRTVRPPGGSCLSVLGQDPGREKLGRRQPNAILSRRTFSLPTVRPAPSSPFASTYAIPRPLQDNAP